MLEPYIYPWDEAESAIVPQWRLLQLSGASQPDYVREVVGRNVRCPVEALHALAGDRLGVVACGVAANVSCPPELLTRLAAHRQGGVRAAAAKNANTTPAILVNLANDSVRQVLEGVAGNAATPAVVVVTLASAAIWQVRSAVARVTSDVELLRTLAEDPTPPRALGGGG